MDNSNPYDYDYEPDREENEDMQQVVLEDAGTRGSARLPPPPPPSRTSGLPPPPPRSPQNNRNSLRQDLEDDEEEPAPKATKPKIPLRERTLCGCIVIGELPLPILNPNFLSQAKESGKFFAIMAGLAEIVTAIIACLLNVLGGWFFMGSTIVKGDQWFGYLAFHIVWGHILLIGLPFMIFFFKYQPFYIASTRPASPLGATMYGIFAVFVIIIEFIYIGQFSGAAGTGLWLAIYNLISALARLSSEYNAGTGYLFFCAAYNFVVPIFWFICGVCNVIQCFSMVQSYQAWKNRREAAAAQDEA